MTIKGMDGIEHSVASNDKANTGVALGAVGTGLSLLSGMGLLGGWNPNNNSRGNDPNARYVTKGELDLIQQLQAKDTQLAAKDSTIALKESEAYTDKKIVDTVTYVNNQMRRLEDKVDMNDKAQQAVNASQMAHNAASDAAVSVIQSQVQSLLGVTKMFIPSSNVCQTGCGCNCGCGNS